MCKSYLFMSLFDIVAGPLGDESGTDVESDTEGGSVGYDDDVGEDRDVLDRELHTLAKEGLTFISIIIHLLSITNTCYWSLLDILENNIFFNCQVVFLTLRAWHSSQGPVLCML